MEIEYNSIIASEIIEKAETIAISAHSTPDGDAVGSCMAMALCLCLMGKKPVVYLEDFTKKLKFLKGIELISDNFDAKEYDLFISLDCANKVRLAGAEKIFDMAKTTIVIDHHISNEYYGDYNLVKGGLSSACEVVYEFIRNFSIINTDIAEAIYTGMLTDTGGFKHSTTSSRTHEIIAELLHFGIDTEKIQEKVFSSHTIAEGKLLARAIENMIFEDSISITCLTKKEILEDCQADYNQLSHIVSYMISYDFAKASAFIYEREDGTIKASMRSKGLDVNKIASKYGGGGHIRAAATVLDCDIEKAKEIILNDFRNGLKQ